MIAAFLYLILGLGLMLLLGKYLTRAVESWLKGRIGDDAHGIRSWRNLVMAGYYCLMGGYLVMSATPLSYSNIAEMVLLVVGKLGPLLLVIGGLAGLISWIRLRKFSAKMEGAT